MNNIFLLHFAVSFFCFSSSGYGITQQATPSRVRVGFSTALHGSDYESGSLDTILQSPNSTFQLQFGTLPGQTSSHGLGIIHTTSSFIVWFTYRPNTLGQYDDLGGDSTTLSLQEDGDLVITVTGNQLDVLVWHSQTSGKGVVAMELAEEGNLKLLNSSNGTVWQSFDHPTDTLLSNQKLLHGMQLLAAARNGYPFKGINTLTVESNRVAIYVTYVEPEPYWQLRSLRNEVVNYAALANGGLSIFGSNGRILATKGNAARNDQNLRRLTLDSDGNPRIYEFANGTWTTVVQFIKEACALPDDCGFYGLCIPGQACACPPSFNLLATLNGCVPSRPLVCNSSHGNDFIKIPYSSYFATPLDSVPNLSFKDCKHLCTSNCSCLGFLYGAVGGSTRPCYITYQFRTFSSSVYLNYTSKYSYDLYVRVQGKPRSKVALIVGLCAPVGVIAFLIILWRFVRVREKAAHQEEEEFLLAALPGLPPRFSYRELKAATKNFKTRIGEGAFGSVYDGVLLDGTRVAVKQLESMLQGKKEFHAEVATIGTIRHVNLVRLCGFCLEKKHRLLVYEHMAKGSLNVLLFDVENDKKLSWKERHSIALGVARGLTYLHEECPECIIHCDIKPENILVDQDGVAKVSDFGLSKLMNRQQDACLTTMRGTRGYLAPEWVLNAPISEKSDVYSYGVVLLEIISGRRNFEFHEDSTKCFLPVWAFSSLERGQLGELMDVKVSEELRGKGLDEEGEVKKALMVAMWCIQEDVALRPSMGKVVRMLEGDLEVEIPPSSRAWAMERQAAMLENLVQSETLMRMVVGGSYGLLSNLLPRKDNRTM